MLRGAVNSHDILSPFAYILVYLHICYITSIEFSVNNHPGMSGKVLKILLLLAVLTTFVSNVLFILKPCNVERSAFPWENVRKLGFGGEEVRPDLYVDKREGKFSSSFLLSWSFCGFLTWF